MLLQLGVLLEKNHGLGIGREKHSNIKYFCGFFFFFFLIGNKLAK